LVLGRGRPFAAAFAAVFFAASLTTFFDDFFAASFLTAALDFALAAFLRVAIDGLPSFAHARANGHRRFISNSPGSRLRLTSSSARFAD
jgi:hypothetical protein